MGAVSETHSQILELFARIIAETDRHKMGELVSELCELLRREERENFDPDLAA